MRCGGAAGGGASTVRCRARAALRAACGFVFAAFATLGASAAPAAAEAVVTVGIGPTLPDGDSARWVGGGVGFAVPTQFWLTFQAHADYFRILNTSMSGVTFGPQIGTTEGAIRPYFMAAFGFSGGDVPYAGFLTTWGAGATWDLSGPAGIFVEGRSVSAGNFEDSGHIRQFRAGLSWRAGRRTARGS